MSGYIGNNNLPSLVPSSPSTLLPTPITSSFSNSSPSIIGNAASSQTLPTPIPSPTPQVSAPPGITQPTTPNTSVSPNQPTSQQLESAVLSILQAGGGLQNPLNSFYQVQPIFTLFLTQTIDPVSAAGNPTNVQSVYSQLNSMPKVILAQTGVTGYNIKSVEFESQVSPNSITRMVNATNVTISIAEQMGSGFPEAILAASQQLGIYNHLKTYWYLQLQFVAYNQDGSIASTSAITSIPGGPQIPNNWIWQLQVTNISANITAGGGNYTITALPFSEAEAYNDSNFYVPDTVQVNGLTLGQFTNNLATQLNASWVTRYGNKTTQYAFKWHTLTEKLSGNFASGFNDPSQYPTTFNNPDFSSVEGLSLNAVNGMPTFILQNGTSIDKFVEAVICNCETAQKLAKDDPSVGQTLTSTPGYRKSIVFRVEPDVQLTAYESFSQQYYKTITYHIWPYYTQIPITDTSQAQTAQQTGVSAQAMQDIIKQGLLNKRYDYLYTGLNIDVIDFNIDYNFQWNAVLPRIQGTRNNSDTIKVPSLVNPNINPVGQGAYSEAQFQSNQISFAAAQSSLASAQNAFQSLPTTASQDQINTAQTNLTQANSTYTAAANNFANNQFNNATPLTATVTQSPSSLTYAEALLTSPPTQSQQIQFATLNIPTTQAFRDADDNAGTGAVSPYHRDKSIFSAVLGQLYAPIAQQFFNIELGIRGDPYWLAESTLQRTVELRSSSPVQKITPNVPDWSYGNTHFVLSFRSPLREGNDFAPVFNQDLTYSGLYAVNKVRSTFGADGFKQVLYGQRLPLINILDAATNAPNSNTPGLVSSNPAIDQNNNPAPSTTNSGGNMNYNTGTGSNPYNWYTSPQAAPYLDTINQASQQYGVPAPLLAWQIGQESSYQNLPASGYTSSGQPVGIAQITTGTAQSVPGYGQVDPTDPNASIMAMAAYDSHLYNQSGSWQSALTSYGTLSGNPPQSVWNGYYNALQQSNLPAGS